VKKENERIVSSIALITFILLVFMMGCAKGRIAQNISEDAIYPKGTVSKAKVFDTSRNEKIISLNRDDAEFLVQTLKCSEKELDKSGYEDGMVELNITFTDSVIQLVREDDKTIYYVFHNKKINGICYKIHSKDLSQFILKVSS
jgi:hypothetical protein